MNILEEDPLTFTNNMHIYQEEKDGSIRGTYWKKHVDAIDHDADKFLPPSTFLSCQNFVIDADYIKCPAANYGSLAIYWGLWCNLSHDLKIMRHNQMKMSTQKKKI